MALYTLACYDCKKETDVKMSFAEHDEFKKNGIPCPTCAKALIQVVTKPKFRMEGSGWYRDGYGSGSGAELESELRKYDSMRNNIERE